MDEARGLADDPAFASAVPFRVGVAAGPRRLPRWKRGADFVFAQMSFSAEALLRWRDSVPPELPVYAGVMVLASSAMADRLAATVPDIDIPPELVERVARDRRAGVDAACALIDELRDSGAFHGVHLVPVSRYREVALQLEHPRT